MSEEAELQQMDSMTTVIVMAIFMVEVGGFGVCRCGVNAFKTRMLAYVLPSALSFMLLGGSCFEA